MRATVPCWVRKSVAVEVSASHRVGQVAGSHAGCPG